MSLGLLDWTTLIAMILGMDPGQITVGANVHVSKARPKFAHDEVVLAADPNDRSRLLAGSMISRNGRNGFELVAYRSLDGGQTWDLALERLKPAESGEFGDPAKSASLADPTIAYSPDGSVYYASLYSRSRVRPAELEIVRSRDGGKTWEAPIKLEADSVDRPFLAVDCTRGKFRGRIYCDCHMHSGGRVVLGVWTSLDGSTFALTPLFPSEKVHGLTNGHGAVLADGTLVVPYKVFDDEAVKEGVYKIRVGRSNTGGESFLKEQMVATEHFYGGAAIIPMLAADPGSEAFQDQLYLVWSQKTPTGQRVLFTLSKDKGVTWSKSIVLSEQSAGDSYESTLPAVAVNRKGIVAVSWYDSRESRGGQPSCNVRLRTSLDGGATWLPSVRVTEVPSAIDLTKRQLGDTAGLAADSAGDFHPLWVDKRTGILQVFTAKISVRQSSSKD
jgi:hypothetical protein